MQIAQHRVALEVAEPGVPLHPGALQLKRPICLRNTVGVDFIGVRQPARARVWGEKTRRSARTAGHRRQYNRARAGRTRQSERRDHADTAWRQFQFDQTHILTLIASYIVHMLPADEQRRVVILARSRASCGCAARATPSSRSLGSALRYLVEASQRNSFHGTELVEWSI